MRLKRLLIYLVLLVLVGSCNKDSNSKKVVLYEKGYLVKETGELITRPEDQRIRIEFRDDIQSPEFVSIYKGDKLLWTFQSSQYNISHGSFYRWECSGPTDDNHNSFCIENTSSCLHYRVGGYKPLKLEATGDLVEIPVDENVGAVGCSDRLIMSSEK